VSLVQAGGRRRWRVAAACAAQLAQPCSAAIPVRQLVEVTDISSLAVSPDGRFLVFRTEQPDVATNSYRLEWHSLDLGSGTVRPIASGGRPVFKDPGIVLAETPLWTSDSRAIVFRALVGEAIGIFEADALGASARPLVVRDENVESLAPGNDGRSILYEVGPSRDQVRRAELDEYDKGILVDSSVDLAQGLFRGGSIEGRMASQRLVGYWFVRGGLLWSWPRQQRRYDLSTGTDQPTGPPRPVPPFDPRLLSGEPAALSAGGDRGEAKWDGRRGTVTALIRRTGEQIRCSDPLCRSGHAEALAWRPGSSQLLVTFRDSHWRDTLALWDAASDRLKVLVRGNGLLSGDRRGSAPCALSASAAFCVAADPASPPKLERIDLGSGAASVLFDPDPEWRTAYSPAVEQLSWTIRGGAHVTGTLLTPSDRRRRAPLFLNYYSCAGFLRGGEGDEWPIPALLDAGFAVACVNAAPSTGPQDAVAAYRAGLEAVRSLIALLDRRGLIDPHKVAMGGFSFGSEVASWVAVHSNLLGALSLASAQAEPAGYWFNAIGGGDRPALMRKVWHLGPPEETRARWQLVSPALNAHRIQIPVLLQLPEQEARRIPELAARLTTSSIPAQLYAFPDEDHLLVQPRHMLAAYQRNLDWFRYWLQGYRDPDPARAGQYQRWDALRARRPSARLTEGSEARARARPSR
jgi:dipeptidyl aminopeptidase/acylaminoacyl peptidase